MDVTPKEVTVLKRAVRVMMVKMDLGLKDPDPTWTQDDIKGIQYDLALLTSLLNKLEAEESRQ